MLDNSSALVLGIGGDPKSFFCYRNELVEKAIDDVREFLTEDDPERVQGVWLLTEYVILLIIIIISFNNTIPLVMDVLVFFFSESVFGITNARELPP